MAELTIALFILASVIAMVIGARSVPFLLPWLLAGVALRVGLFLLGYFEIWYAPGARADGARFIRVAETYSQLPWPELFALFDYRSGFSYSILGAVLFKLFGYDWWLMPAANILLGSINVLLGALIAYRLWGGRAALIATAIMALYPFAAFNSVVALREELSILFFMVGLYVLLGWLQRGSLASFLGAIVFFVMASFIHPGWIAAPVGLILAVLFIQIRRALASPASDTMSPLRAFAAVTVMIAVLIPVLVGGVQLGKGIVVTADLDELSEVLESRFQRAPVGGSAYPDIIARGDPISQPWLIPARIVYFLYSPFPWDIRSAIHLTGLVTSLMYLFLTVRAWQARAALTENERNLALVFMLAALIFVFSMGVTNIGTAIRHKTKLFFLFVIIAAPALKRTMQLRRTD